MNGFLKAKMISQKHELMGVVNRIDYGLAGDNPEWLKEYFNELLEDKAFDLDQKLAAFRDIERLCEDSYVSNPKDRKPVKPVQCELCGYKGLFCKHNRTQGST